MVDNKMTKSVGEHWVCACLARHGWAPALTRDGLERTDILAVGTRLPGRPTVEIQVKTASGDGDKTAWILGTKAQLVAKSVHEWFALVMLPSLPKPPRTFIVPRNHLSAATWVAHQTWRTDPTVPEGRRNTDLALARINATAWRGYEDRWDLLGTPTSDVPVLLPSWIRSRSQEERVGLPPGHPWNESLPDW